MFRKHRHPLAGIEKVVFEVGDKGDKGWRRKRNREENRLSLPLHVKTCESFFSCGWWKNSRATADNKPDAFR